MRGEVDEGEQGVGGEIEESLDWIIEAAVKATKGIISPGSVRGKCAKKKIDLVNLKFHFKFIIKVTKFSHMILYNQVETKASKDYMVYIF